VTGPSSSTAANPSPASASPHRPDLAQLAGDDLAGDAGPTRPLAYDGGRRVEHDRIRRDVVALAERAPGRAPLRVEAGRVHHRDQPAPHPLGDDQLEELERVPARAQVVLARADHRAQPIRRDDLLGSEPLVRPLRLARCRRPHQHHEARVGQPDGHAC